MKNAKIVASKFNREWSPADNPDNVTYYHDIELDNGDKGSCGAKEKNPQTLAVHQILTYTIEESPKGNKIKRVTENKWSGNKGNGSYSKEPFEERAVASAYNQTAVLFSHKAVEEGKSFTIDQYITASNKVYDAMLVTAKRGKG